MTNTYEQMLLNDKAALITKISNLVEGKLNNGNEVSVELNLIAKVIDFSYSIEDECSYQLDCSHLRGQKTFASVEDYEARDYHYGDAEEAEADGVDWADGTEFWGSFSWDDCPSVSVEVLGLTEDASEEAKTLWEAQKQAQEDQQRLDWKRKRLERAQKELLELQADLDAAEANA